MVLDQVSLLIFDFDGTLFNLPVDYTAVRRELGVPADTSIGPLLQQYLDDGDIERLAVVTRHECASVPAGRFTAGAQQCLSAPGRRAIVTRNSRQAVLAPLGDLADGVLVVGREDVRRLKPDPEGVRRVLSHFGADPVEAVLVGDTYHDVQAARAAGVRSVIIHNPLLAYTPPHADHYLNGLANGLDTVLQPTETRRANRV